MGRLLGIGIAICLPAIAAAIETKTTYNTSIDEKCQYVVRRGFCVYANSEAKYGMRLTMGGVYLCGSCADHLADQFFRHVKINAIHVEDQVIETGIVVVFFVKLAV